MSELDAILLIEGGDDTTQEQELAAWQVLIDSGAVWQLQGFYGRTATDLINRGLVKPKEAP